MDALVLYALYVACPLATALFFHIIGRSARYMFSSTRRFLVSCAVLSTLALLVGFGAWFVPLWVRLVRAWLFNLGHACAIDRARRTALLELYEVPLVGPLAAILAPWVGLPSWGEVHLDYGVSCQLLDHYGYVPILTAPPMVLWFKWACYFVCTLSAPLACLWLYFSFCTLQVIRRAFSGWALNVDAPVLPFTLQAATAEVLRLSNALVGEVKNTPIEDGHHKRLALVRARTEMTMLQFLRRYTLRTRDVGGSLTRNQKFGRDHHICYPNLDAADHRRVQLMNECANNAEVHLGQDCPCRTRLSIMSYVDFHLSRDELCRAIQSPTLIITHDFAAHQGVRKWYDGEATVEVNRAGVSMQTAGGSSYVHGYHHWGPEGVLISQDTVLQYRRLGFVDKYTMVLLAWPSSGTYYRNDPLNLRSSSGMTEAADCSHGVIAVRTSVDAGKLVFSFRKDGEEIGQVPLSTIIRSAHALASLTRGERYRATSDSVVRSRFVADEADLNLLPYASVLVSKLSDEMALNTAHDSWISGSPSDLSWVHRRVLGLLALACNNAGIFRPIIRHTFRWVIGTSRHNSLTPWSWKDIRVPMYEVIPPNQQLETVENTTPSRPFSSGGQGDVAGPAPPSSDVPRQNDGECSNLTPNQSVESRPVTPPSAPAEARVPQPEPAPARSLDSPIPCTEPTCAGKHKPGTPCVARKPCNGVCRHADGTPVRFHNATAKCRGDQPKPPAKASRPSTSGSKPSPPSVPPPNPVAKRSGRRSTQTGGKDQPRRAEKKVQPTESTPRDRRPVGGRMDKNGAAPKNVRNRGPRRAGPNRPRTQRQATPPAATGNPPPDVHHVPSGGAQPVDAASRSTSPGWTNLNAMAEPFFPQTATGAEGSPGGSDACGSASQTCPN